MFWAVWKWVVGLGRAAQATPPPHFLHWAALVLTPMARPLPLAEMIVLGKEKGLRPKRQTKLHNLLWSPVDQVRFIWV
jgi:hypothetical protein